MKRFVEGIDRSQSTMFPERLEDWVRDDNPVRVVDVFVDALDLRVCTICTYIRANSRSEAQFSIRRAAPAEIIPKTGNPT